MYQQVSLAGRVFHLFVTGGVATKNHGSAFVGNSITHRRVNGLVVHRKGFNQQIRLLKHGGGTAFLYRELIHVGTGQFRGHGCSAVVCRAVAIVGFVGHLEAIQYIGHAGGAMYGQSLPFSVLRPAGH